MPYNEYIDKENGSKELAKIAIKHGARTVDMVQRDNRLTIEIRDPTEPVAVESLFYFMEGLSIAIGQLAEGLFDSGKKWKHLRGLYTG